MAQWLAGRVWAHEDFQWDTGNSAKSALKHMVSMETVEALFAHAFLFEGLIVEPEHEEARWLLLGKAGKGGRGFALIFTRRGSLIRPISCRAMRNNERSMYENQDQE